MFDVDNDEEVEEATSDAGRVVLPDDGDKFELLISATDLIRPDEPTNSNQLGTVCVIYKRLYGQWSEVGRTELLHRCASPQVKY